MKALSIRPEFTFDIFTGYQPYKERTWQTDYAGIVEDYMAEVEMDAEEEAFENGDNEQE